MIPRDVRRLPMNVLCAAQGKIDQARTHSGIRHFINQDKTTQRPVFRIRRKWNITIRRHISHTNCVQLKRFGRRMFHRIDVDLIFGFRHRCRDGLRPNFQVIRTAWNQRLFIHPNQGGFKLIGHFKRSSRGSDHLTAGTIHLIFERQCD